MPREFSKFNRVSNFRRRGVAMVEMAFAVVILLTLTLGLIQWGMILNASIAITNLSREGARYAAVHHDVPDSEIAGYVKTDAPPGINPDDLIITISPAEGTPERSASQQAITVSVAYSRQKKLFLPTKAFGINFFSGIYKAEGHMMME